MKDDLNCWYPVDITLNQEGGLIKWVFLPERFTEPFFYDTISRSKQHRYSTFANIDYLEKSAKSLGNIIHSSIFIFHISRCGSTLVSQMLASLSKFIAISEAEILDQIIRCEVNSSMDAQSKKELFQIIIKYFGRRRFAAENKFLIKLDSWHILRFDFINYVFPNVPKIFLYRNPLEVFLSHNATRGMQMVPGILGSEEFPYIPFKCNNNELNRYSIFVLYNFLKAGLEICKTNKDNLLLLNYSQLPDEMWKGFADYTEVEFNSNDIETMKAAARINSKHKNFEYKGDSYLENIEIDNDSMELINLYLMPVYNELEKIRLVVDGRI